MVYSLVKGVHSMCHACMLCSLVKGNSDKDLCPFLSLACQFSQYGRGVAVLLPGDAQVPVSVPDPGDRGHLLHIRQDT